MINIDARACVAATPYKALVEALDAQFREPCICPPRHVHKIDGADSPAGSLLLMPAWATDQFLGLKIATLFPGNGRFDLPTSGIQYLLMSARTGEMLASIDGSSLTSRRTAATCVLAARFLARSDAERLLVVGAGTIARHLVSAYADLRPGLSVAIWARDPLKARAVAEAAAESGIALHVETDLERGVRDADIVSCATFSESPLVQGAWLKPGAHVDMVGGYTPDMREADDDTIERAARVVCDTLTALDEAGDLIVPIQRGVLGRDDVDDLAALCRQVRPGRTSAHQITVFKSVGCALEDLAAAALAYAASRPSAS